jgi:hypothetical protein
MTAKMEVNIEKKKQVMFNNFKKTRDLRVLIDEKFKAKVEEVLNCS